MSVNDHRFLKIRRTLIDVSSTVSRREGVLLYQPGRRWLRIVPRILSWFSWLPWPGRIRWDDVLPGFDLEAAVGKVDYATIYIGNSSARSKFTLKTPTMIVKVARTDGGKSAIRQEVEVLIRLDGLDGQVPRLLDEGDCGEWHWSSQTILPRGKSPNKMQKEHYEFLEKLKAEGISHGDFTPWNCSIVDGKLVVWDWEEAVVWIDGKDELWFNTQVKLLL